MLYLLSAADAFPEQKVSSAELTGIKDPGNISVESRFCALSLSYIKETCNKNIKDAPKASICSTTELGALALEKALALAGIEKESLGLVIGDTCTPCEFCPSEAQRITGKLGLKIPAYDIIASTTSLSAQLKTLLSWKPEKVPSVTALVSSQTTSQVADYSQKESLLLGDGASALLVSTQKKSNVVVKKAYYELDTSFNGFLLSTPYEHLTLGEIPSDEFILSKVKKIIEGLSPSSKNISLIVSPLFEECVLSEVKKLTDASVTLLSSFSKTGDTFNAYAGSLLSKSLSEGGRNLKPHDEIMIIQFGSGFSYGGILLENVPS